MLISRTSQYAIQSLIYLATQSQGAPVKIKDVAEKLQVPSAYLSKIMQELAKGGLVTSFRGPLGGFILSADPSEIDLLRILLVTEGNEFTKACMLGLKLCSDETACPMHEQWKPIKEQVIQMLHHQTLVILSEAVLTGKYRISDIPYALLPRIQH